MENSETRQERAYRIVYSVLRPLAAVLYPMRATGRENIPAGPAIVCANHSSYVDPVLVAFAFGKRNYMHFMAKIELRAVPVLGRVLEDAGVFFVDRSKPDIYVVRAAMRFLKDGQRVFLFPEGTRTAEDNQVEAKTGAVRIAEKMGVPIIPVYVPRHKKIFGRVHIAIGRPFRPEGKTHADFARLSDEVMDRIYALRDGSGE